MTKPEKTISTTSRLFKYHLEWLRSRKDKSDEQVAKIDERILNVVASCGGRVPVIHIEALLLKRQEASIAANVYVDSIVHFRKLESALSNRVKPCKKVKTLSVTPKA